MAQTTIKFTVAKIIRPGTFEPLKTKEGFEIWYDTRPEAEKAYNDLENKDDHIIMEKKENA